MPYLGPRMCLTTESTLTLDSDEARGVPVIACIFSLIERPRLFDTSCKSNPRGFAIWLSLARTLPRLHPGTTSCSTPFSSLLNGREALSFFLGAPDGTIASQISSHLAALPFVEAPTPFSTSFERGTYPGIIAFRLVSADEKEELTRYR